MTLKNTFKINDVKKYLEERTVINGINDNFLSLFSTPRTGLK